MDPLKRLVLAWQAVTRSGSLVLPGDQSAISASRDRTVLHNSFASYCEDAMFGIPDDKRLHLGLIPIPYMGNLAKADIFLLMLNPGLSHGDYFAEEHFPEYRKQLFDNLHQISDVDFPFLDPLLSWHPGGVYWLGRFTSLAVELQSEVGSFKEALKLLSRRVACLELVPYHSPHFGLPPKLVDSLESVRLILAFAQEYLAPRAARGEVLLIATRQVKRWGLEKSENVILYEPSQARGGHVTPASPGGKAILRFLGEKNSR